MGYSSPLYVSRATDYLLLLFIPTLSACVPCTDRARPCTSATGHLSRT